MNRSAAIFGPSPLRARRRRQLPPANPHAGRGLHYERPDMRKVALMLTLEDGDSRTSFAAEQTYTPTEDPQKRVIGQLMVETLLALDHHIVGSYSLTCLAEALEYLDSVDGVEPDWTPLIDAAEAFLDKRRAKAAARRAYAKRRAIKNQEAARKE